MTKKVFYSFHYERDNWRVNQIKKMGVVENQPILDSQDWEDVKRGGNQAIKNWINEQMAGKSAVVVLVGKETAERYWVRYEIEQAWNKRIPLLGVRINRLHDSNGSADYQGNDPFEYVPTNDGQKLSSFVPLIEPVGLTSTSVYADIKNNLPSWLNRAYKQS